MKNRSLLAAGSLLAAVLALAPMAPTYATDPVLTAGGGNAGFVEGDPGVTPVVIDPGITVSPGSATGLVSGSVAIVGNLHSGEDVLGFVGGSGTGNITGSYNGSTGLLTLTSAGGTATPAQWQAALASVTYADTAITPNTATRTVAFSLVDSDTISSNTLTETVTVTATEQSPVLASSASGAVSYHPGYPATAVDPTLVVTDADNTTLSSATITIGSGQAGDVLTFVNSSAALFGNIVGSYNAASHVLTLTSSGATAALAQWSAALSAVTFSTAAGTGARTVTFMAHDGSKPSNQVIRTVDVRSATHTVTFDAQGGTAEPAQTIPDGGVVAAPTLAPTRAGFSFERWSTSTNGSAYDFSTPVTTDLTLFAVWTPLATPPVTTPPVTTPPVATPPVTTPPVTTPPVTTPPSCHGRRATIVGTAGADELLGTSGDDVIVGLAGDDRISGRGGNDVICAGAGDDTIHAGAGADQLAGGSGHDRMWGGAGDDVLRGGGSDAWSTARPSVTSDVLRGGQGDDTLYGDGGPDRLIGGPGTDHLHGNHGHDTLRP